MNTSLQKNDEPGLRFFGKVTAAITHDVKNSLATINENAGLLTDYVALAERGQPLDPERVAVLASRIKDQVKRADDLLKNMNRFAHSVDASSKKVDLNETLQLLAALSVRFAAMCGTTLDVRPSSNPVEIETSPFELLKTLFLCLEFAMNAAERGCSLQLRSEKTATGACVHFGPLQQDALSGQDPCLSASVDARLVKKTEAGTLTLIITDR